MGRGRKGNCKRDLSKNVRSKGGSDSSDEDYVVEDEINESEDDSEDLGNSLDEFASEESFGGSVDAEEEDEEEEEEVRKFVRPKKNKKSLKNRKSRARIVRKRKRVSSEEDEDEDYVGDDDDVDDEDDEEYCEDENEEFTPDEDEDDEVIPKKKNNNVKVQRVKRSTRKRGSGRGRKRRKSKVLRKPLAKKRRNNKRLKKKEKTEYEDTDNLDFIDNDPFIREKSKNTLAARRRKYAVYSDSDFVSSGSSDKDYTISEEEKEQVGEDNELFGDLKISLRGSSSEKRVLDEGDSCQHRQPLHRKGKEKVKEIVAEVVKQVCGICLSEEDRRRLRGTLNCCSHYFCFTCIMEWSKVESRCPLCKQRFRTITKNGRSNPGPDLRNVVIQVPERDQVYQPSEEEIRSFIDPYENVMCTVCHEGGDDGLMLLCDLCDSPAHTFCVGLGRQVPDGNWYCDDCRPVALGSSSSLAQNPLPDQRTASSNIFSRPSPLRTFESLEPISESSPRVTFAHGIGNLSSPRFPVGDVQVASPVYGSGAPTLSNRREIHRRIQNIISITRMNHMAGRSDGFSAANMHSDLSNSQIDQVRETTVQNSRIQEIGPLQHTFLEDRLQANCYPSASVQNRDSFSFRPSQFSRQISQDPTVTTTDQSINLTLWPQPGVINSMPGYEQLHCNGRLGIGSGGNSSPYRVREESRLYMEIEQLKSMVKSHLKNLSKDTELGHDTFNDIERSSTHTILAACGREPWQNNSYTVRRPSSCSHIDRMLVGQKSMMEDLCYSCFDSFVRDVVERNLDTRRSPWLRLGL
ncbi:hypothetical protein Tsubulata_021309 [Turnera subulata]|uniref:RING-type domain-containing protein n=1 Tax=Turnera subulata TaxID=218843 RepID=A0A9Q0FRQ8_9ROSI|nr:hypothetical protein Tsubulata_021309 [Turnera subulata]